MNQHGETIINAAARVEEAAGVLGEAYRELDEALSAVRTEAFRVAGLAGAQDVDSRIGRERLRTELLGLLLASGLGAALGQRVDIRGERPVGDFAHRWRDRVESGQLETTRRGVS